MVEGPGSVFIVPLHDDGRTVLVRQWRHAWDRASWEVPAGTMEAGEDPLQTARRELREEAGLDASRWTPLGLARGTAVGDFAAHLYLARGLSRAGRAPEDYEHDMVVLEVPFEEALAEALGGGIEHASSIAAITRAARALGLL